MRFTQIRLENWRNFGDVDIPVARRVFLVGANASGKSNFLDALRFLRELVIAGGGFEKAVQDRGGVSTIRNLAARQSSDVALDIRIGEDEHYLWRYRIVFNQLGRRPVLREEKIWNSADELLLDRPDESDKKDNARLGQTHLEQVFANIGFREISDFFRSTRYFHVVPQLVREPERTAAGYRNDPFGSDFLELVAGTDKRSQLPRLGRIQKILRDVVPQLADIELWRDERGIPHLRGKYLHWRPHGAWQTEREFSDGTLRLIGFLWALQDGEGPLMLEEPELSLHPALVRLLPPLMVGIQRDRRKALRQTILSTHSPELLADKGIGADEMLLVMHSPKGSTIIPGADQEDIVNELEAGLTMADVALPRTRPPALEQLLLWGS